MSSNIKIINTLNGATSIAQGEEYVIRVKLYTINAEKRRVSKIWAQTDEGATSRVIQSPPYNKVLQIYFSKEDTKQFSVGTHHVRLWVTDGEFNHVATETLVVVNPSFPFEVSTPNKDYVYRPNTSPQLLSESSQGDGEMAVGPVISSRINLANWFGNVTHLKVGEHFPIGSEIGDIVEVDNQVRLLGTDEVILSKETLLDGGDNMRYSILNMKTPLTVDSVISVTSYDEAGNLVAKIDKLNISENTPGELTSTFKTDDITWTTLLNREVMSPAEGKITLLSEGDEVFFSNHYGYHITLSVTDKYQTINQDKFTYYLCVDVNPSKWQALNFVFEGKREGLVPRSTELTQNRYLKGDGTWSVIDSSSIDTTDLIMSGDFVDIDCKMEDK